MSRTPFTTNPAGSTLISGYIDTEANIVAIDYNQLAKSLINLIPDAYKGYLTINSKVNKTNASSQTTGRTIKKLNVQYAINPKDGLQITQNPVSNLYTDLSLKFPAKSGLTVNSDGLKVNADGDTVYIDNKNIMHAVGFSQAINRVRETAIDEVAKLDKQTNQAINEEATLSSANIDTTNKTLSSFNEETLTKIQRVIVRRDEKIAEKQQLEETIAGIDYQLNQLEAGLAELEQAENPYESDGFGGMTPEWEYWDTNQTKLINNAKQGISDLQATKEQRNKQLISLNKLIDRCNDVLEKYKFQLGCNEMTINTIQQIIETQANQKSFLAWLSKAVSIPLTLIGEAADNVVGGVKDLWNTTFSNNNNVENANAQIQNAATAQLDTLVFNVPIQLSGVSSLKFGNTTNDTADKILVLSSDLGTTGTGNNKRITSIKGIPLAGDNSTSIGSTTAGYPGPWDITINSTTGVATFENCMAKIARAYYFFDDQSVTGLGASGNYEKIVYAVIDMNNSTPTVRMHVQDITGKSNGQLNNDSLLNGSDSNCLTAAVIPLYKISNGQVVCDYRCMMGIQAYDSSTQAIQLSI